jgi:hypothetical protein
MNMNNFDQEENKRRLKQTFAQHVNAIDITAAILIVILVMTSTFFILRYSQIKQVLDENQRRVVAQEINVDVLDFTRDFIDKVLKAEGEIDFETRLDLESAVRAIGDDEILSAWQVFTNSQTETEAQTAVKNLLSLLVSRIQ